MVAFAGKAGDRYASRQSDPSDQGHRGVRSKIALPHHPNAVFPLGSLRDPPSWRDCRAAKLPQPRLFYTNVVRPCRLSGNIAGAAPVPQLSRSSNRDIDVSFIVGQRRGGQHPRRAIAGPSWVSRPLR